MKKAFLSITCSFCIFYLQAQILFCPIRYNDRNQDSAGIIVKFLPATNTLTVVHTFSQFATDGSSGTAPSGRLVQASDGKLYGTTLGGGNNSTGYGTIFSLDPSSYAYKELWTFDNAN